MWPSLGRGELFLSLPGSMFGVPVYSMGIMSVVVAGLAELVSADSCYIAPAIAVAYVIAAVAFWAMCVEESKELYTLQHTKKSDVPTGENGMVTVSKKDTHGLMRPFAPLGKKLGTVTTLLGTVSPSCDSSWLQLCLKEYLLAPLYILSHQNESHKAVNYWTDIFVYLI